MGGVFSLTGLACCAGTTACNAVCSVFHACQNSTLSKLMYAGILLFTLVLACLMLAPGVQQWLTKVPFCEESETTLGKALKAIPGAIGGDAVKIK